MLITPDGPNHCHVEFTWSDDDPAQPARSVLLRLLTPTDFANDDGDLGRYLMDCDVSATWRATLRLPSDLRTSYQFCPVRDRELPAQVDAEDWEKVCALGVPDPANTAVIGPSTWPDYGSASVLELPAARPQPWHARRSGVARGEVTRHTLGTSALWVYTPHGYAEGTGNALAILFDGKVWDGIDVAATLDNLLAEGLLPPTVVVGVESIRDRPRNEALVDTEALMSFLLDDLLPFVTEGWRVTADPGRTVLAGQSLGGLAATYAGLRAPERFGLILTQSGSFWRGAGGDGEIDSPALMDQIAREDPRPIRIFQEAGSLERNLLVKNRILYGVLLARGYAVTYREYQGGHDYACWRGGLADGLISLLGR